MLTYLKKGISLKSTENLILWVVGLPLLLTDLARKEANIYDVSVCTSILFDPSNNHIFTSEKTDTENEISCFKIYSQEVEEPCKIKAI